MNANSNQGRKKLFVARSLWTCIEALWEATPQFKYEFQCKGDFVSRFLEALNELSLATWERDADENLVCEPTPKLLTETGTEPGPLDLCGYVQAAPSRSHRSDVVGGRDCRSKRCDQSDHQSQVASKE